MASYCLVYLPRPHHADVGLLALGVPDLCVLLLENVDKPSAQLGVEVQVEEMWLCLLFLHDLNKREYYEKKNFFLQKTIDYL